MVAKFLCCHVLFFEMRFLVFFHMTIKLYSETYKEGFIPNSVNARFFPNLATIWIEMNGEMLPPPLLPLSSHLIPSLEKCQWHSAQNKSISVSDNILNISMCTTLMVYSLYHIYSYSLTLFKVLMSSVTFHFYTYDFISDRKINQTLTKYSTYNISLIPNK